jgi:predicted dehydrogenase
MQDTTCRWGILGAAEIARKNWQAIRNAPNCRLTAVASRDLDRCRTFIDQCQRCAPFDPPPRAFGNYDELLAADAVDAVYIPLPTGVRKPWAIRAAEAGKHVLVEKPVGASSQDVRDILAACRLHGVQFMDGVMFMHSRRMERIRDVLADGQTIGAIRRITCQFSDGEANGDSFAGNIRADGRLEPLGCLGDLGWYTIRFILWAMDWELPAGAVGHMLGEYRAPQSSAGVPADFSAELFFADGVSASFFCSFSAHLEQWVNLAGTLGSLYVPDFVLPRHGDDVVFETSNPLFTITGCDFVVQQRVRRHAVREASNSAENAQETNMFRRFAELAASGRPDESWGEMSLATQQVLDACLQSARSGGRAVDLRG